MPVLVSSGKPAHAMRDPSVWAREFTDPEILRLEQERLGRRAWTMLGFTHDLANDGDWIRADLWGRSVFVQRFKDKLAAFENVCAHRFFPLKTEDNGNGQLKCGLHGWVYNGEGKAIGIPLCEELFGKKQGEMDFHLRPIEIDICGCLVFGRLPSAPGDNFPRQTLVEYLGPMARLTQRLTEAMGAMEMFDTTIAANWKVCYHLTLEDYHIGAAHPKTFSAQGHLKPGTFRYFNAGPHSALFMGEEANEKSFVLFQAECAQKRLPRQGYRIFQIFPNLLMSLWDDVTYIGRYVPTAPNKCTLNSWFAEAFPSEAPFSKDRRQEVRDLYALIMDEDRLSAERLQQTLPQSGSNPLFGGEEERIVWFDDTYARFMD